MRQLGDPYSRAGAVPWLSTLHGRLQPPEQLATAGGGGGSTAASGGVGGAANAATTVMSPFNLDVIHARCGLL